MSGPALAGRPRRSLSVVIVVGLVATCEACTPWSLVGEVDHTLVQRPFSVEDPIIGGSSGFPVAVQIIVSERSRGPLRYIGELAHRELFARYPDFAFSVVFASAKNECGHSHYADPSSPWFNMFFGFYEIDVPVSRWNRPFGYASADADALPVVEELLRIGTADWDYFSNHMYGVPLDAIGSPESTLAQAHFEDRGRRRLPNGLYWDLTDLSNVDVVTPFRSSDDNGRFDDRPHAFGPLWRLAFGEFPPSRFQGRPSFFHTKMRAEVLSFHDEAHRVQHYDERVYRTFFFGATVPDEYPDEALKRRFLREQRLALDREIESLGGNPGFTSDRPGVDGSACPRRQESSSVCAD